MKDLIELINSSLDERTGDLAAQKKVWEALAGYFRPDIKLYGHTRPSVILSRETGDLGLAVLWIVQTALARPVLGDLLPHMENTSALSLVTSRINDSTLISMAHSESAEAPVTCALNGGSAAISGTKKFITAGRNSGVIMVSCREKGSPKIDRIALLGNDELPAGAMTPLDLKIMRTVDHTSLTLDEFQIEAGRIPAADPRAVRRSMKKWGIIERALIVESFLAFLLYCRYLFADLGATIASEDEIISLLEKQTAAASKQIDEAFNKNEVTTSNIGMTDIISLTGRFQNMYRELEHELRAVDKIRLADLFLFNSFKG